LKKVDEFFGQLFGLLITFIENDLTPQQKKIWILLAQEYPKQLTGVEIAGKIGSSKISKSIYQSLKDLEKNDLIIIEQPHPKVHAIKLNPNHTLSALLKEFCNFYGSK
jgi:hypothetical protein